MAVLPGNHSTTSSISQVTPASGTTYLAAPLDISTNAQGNKIQYPQEPGITPQADNMDIEKFQQYLDELRNQVREHEELLNRLNNVPLQEIRIYPTNEPKVRVVVTFKDMDNTVNK